VGDEAPHLYDPRTPHGPPPSYGAPAMVPPHSPPRRPPCSPSLQVVVVVDTRGGAKKALGVVTYGASLLAAIAVFGLVRSQLIGM
jgi:hypothetical protein